MNHRSLLSFLIEAAASGIMMYAAAHPDTNYPALFWLIVVKGARTVAQVAGRLGMRAEVRYFATV